MRGCAGWSASMLFAYGKTITDHFVPRSFRTQVISYHFSYLVPIFILNLVILYPVLVTSGTRLVSTFTWIWVVSTIPFASESFRPPNRFVYFSVRPCVVSPTFPFASQVDSPPYKFCFGLLIGAKLVLFEILNNEQWTVSLMYIYIFNLGIDKGEITYMIYLEELTYIYLFI